MSNDYENQPKNNVSKQIRNVRIEQIRNVRFLFFWVQEAGQVFIHKSIALFLRAPYKALCCGGCGVVGKNRFVVMM